MVRWQILPWLPCLLDSMNGVNELLSRCAPNVGPTIMTTYYKNRLNFSISFPVDNVMRVQYKSLPSIHFCHDYCK